ncbi:hypothetical protein [Sphingopyxis sp.]|uniref:hypothetical protein n=1 Tax=Sphingopyxis sp. TaxID=1908224 RepID=UPI002B45C98A|nr:hypothetical protein [Sphingopyxis sp.]HJS11622.1 hypothetical protein [Sphingopyxis sp.]
MVWSSEPKTIEVKCQRRRSWPTRGAPFLPPALDEPLELGFEELYLAIGRMIALASARESVVRTFQRNARETIKVLIDRDAPDLRAMIDIGDLADQGLVQFAHDMAVGVAAIAMQNAGFTWVDHAKEVLPRSRRRPDYVWSTGRDDGSVILSEVKGMASSKTPFGTLRAKVEEAWEKQVRPWALDRTSAGDPIVGGYAIGVHIPAGREAGVAALRSVPARVRARYSGGGPEPVAEGPGTVGPSISVARGHYRAALTLIGARGPAARLLQLPYFDSEVRRFDIVDAGELNFVVPRFRSQRELMLAMELDAFRFALKLAMDDPGPLADRPFGGQQGLGSEGPSRVLSAPRFEPGIRNNLLLGETRIAALAPDGLAILRGGVKPRVIGQLDVSGIGAVSL